MTRLSNQDLQKYAQLHQGTDAGHSAAQALLDAATLEGPGHPGPSSHKYAAKRDTRPCYRALLDRDGALSCHACPVCGGRAWIPFQSHAEATRYDQLVLELRAGMITGLELQVRYPLHCPADMGAATSSATSVVAHYYADFRYVRSHDPATGQHAYLVVEDVKGLATPMYRLKRKWMQLEYGITIQEIYRGKPTPTTTLMGPSEIKVK